MLKVFRESHLALADRRQGKVRESYALPGGHRLFVTTDRLSAFDRVLGCVPYKGQVLNELAAWWFQHLTAANHLVGVPDPNALVAVEAEPLDVEVVMRGYITGVTGTSLWHRYELGERQIYGYELPEGLRKNQALPEPLLTPTTKGGPSGHDERLTCAEAAARVGDDWDTVAAMAREIFSDGQKVARQRGLLLVDSKYEFGRTPDGRIILIDEVHTPDSSRFWEASTYAERLADGEEPDSLDKEFVRLEYAERGYRGEGEPPEVPDELWHAASRLYIAVFERLTGHSFVPGLYPVEERLTANLQREGWL